MNLQTGSALEPIDPRDATTLPAPIFCDRSRNLAFPGDPRGVRLRRPRSGDGQHVGERRPGCADGLSRQFAGPSGRLARGPARWRANGNCAIRLEDGVCIHHERFIPCSQQTQPACDVECRRAHRVHNRQNI